MDVLNRLRRWVLRWRVFFAVLLNVLITLSSFFLALLFRFDFDLGREFSFFQLGLPLVLLCLFRGLAYILYGLNRGYWRYVSTNEAVDILKAHAASSLLLAASLGVLRIDAFPRSLILLEFTLSLLFAMGARLLVRLWCERMLRDVNDADVNRKDIVVIGGDISGHLLVKTLLGLPAVPYRPVAIFDDSELSTGAEIHGVRIVGAVSSLGSYLEANPNISAVIVAAPALSELRYREIRDVCATFDLPLMRLQSFEDIACSEAREPRIVSTIEEMLSREVKVDHEDEIREEIKGKKILVTGAGGSIGSELVRQIVGYSPEEVVLLDSSEYNLYSIRQELSQSFPAVRLSYCLGSVCDRVRLTRVFRDHLPQLVFHAAAYKHVPLLEENCYEAFRNNVLGTRNVVELSRRHGVRRFVLVSTDKAVDPSSIMGCTKRIAEVMTATVDRLSCSAINGNNAIGHGANGHGADGHGANGHGADGHGAIGHGANGYGVDGRGHAMSTAVVRFGNVINSAGSVIPLFKKQILEGGPITVTHPEMERYFMSVREAVRLVLTAGTLGDRGEIYLLDMGEPIKIVEVARKLLALYGRSDIAIEFTGLRPGEKLTERLYSLKEVRSQTRFAKIYSVCTPAGEAQNVFDWVAAVEQKLHELGDLQVEAALRSYLQVLDSSDKSTVLEGADGGRSMDQSTDASKFPPLRAANA